MLSARSPAYKWLSGSVKRDSDSGEVRRCTTQLRSRGPQIPENLADPDQYHEALQYRQQDRG
jgi:hypothetical protein